MASPRPAGRCDAGPRLDTMLRRRAHRHAASAYALGQSFPHASSCARNRLARSVQSGASLFCPVLAHFSLARADLSPLIVLVRSGHARCAIADDAAPPRVQGKPALNQIRAGLGQRAPGVRGKVKTKSHGALPRAPQTPARCRGRAKPSRPRGLRALCARQAGSFHLAVAYHGLSSCDHPNKWAATTHTDVGTGANHISRLPLPRSAKALALENRGSRSCIESRSGVCYGSTKK